MATVVVRDGLAYLAGLVAPGDGLPSPAISVFGTGTVPGRSGLRVVRIDPDGCAHTEEEVMVAMSYPVAEKGRI